MPVSLCLASIKKGTRSLLFEYSVTKDTVDSRDGSTYHGILLKTLVEQL